MAEQKLIHKWPTDGEATIVQRKIARSKLQKIQHSFLGCILRNQIQLSSTLILGLACLHFLYPRWRPHTRKFFELSYGSSTTHGKFYTQGMDDIYFILAWIVNFTALRAITLKWILQPLATILNVAPKSHLRFAEQGWIFLYYSTFWGVGLYLWYNSDYWLNNAELWTAWPSSEMSGLFKWYYLVQLSFCAQQLLTIHLEARRKDYVEMFCHHIITCSLISITYAYRYTRAANVVLCLMDVIDILLPLAKILRYLRFEAACNVAFVIFVVMWFLTRHVIYLHLCWDIYVNVPGPTTMLFGCYDGTTNTLLPNIPAQPDYFSHLFWPFRSLDSVVCLNTEVKYIFLGMLLLLHTLSSIWFVMILRVIAGIFLGKSAEDIRSDDEDEEQRGFKIEDQCTRGGAKLDGQIVDTFAMASRLGNELDNIIPCTGTGSEISDVNMGTSTISKASAKSRAMVGRRLIVTESRKELLARIGCEKPI